MRAFEAGSEMTLPVEDSGGARRGSRVLALVPAY